MVLKCPVILNNDSVTVVKYNDVEVQFPTIGRDIGYVNVDFVDGKYKIVEKTKDENKFNIAKVKEPKADKIEKKTTIKEAVKPQSKKEFSKKA